MGAIAIGSSQPRVSKGGGGCIASLVHIGLSQNVIKYAWNSS